MKLLEVSRGHYIDMDKVSSMRKTLEGGSYSKYALELIVDGVEVTIYYGGSDDDEKTRNHAFDALLCVWQGDKGKK